MLDPATYCSSTPRIQSRGTAGLPGTRRKRLRCAWHEPLHGLATAIHKTSGLAFFSLLFPSIPPTVPKLKVTLWSLVSNPPLTGSRARGEICYKTGKRKLIGVLVNFQAVIGIRALLFTTEAHIYCKSEIRISKSETNSNYQNPNDRNNR